MPVKPENRKLYPANWKQIVGLVRERSGDRCEWEGCGVPNHVWGVRFPDGRFEVLACPPFDRDLYETDGGRVVRIILTTAHLDHDPTNCDLSNLRRWCQYHHLRYDARHHAETARKTREAEALKAQPLLLEEVPPSAPHFHLVVGKPGERGEWYLNGYTRDGRSVWGEDRLVPDFGQLELFGGPR